MVSVAEIYESAVGKSSSLQRRFKNGLKEVEENPQLNIVMEAPETLGIWKTVHRIIFLFEDSQKALVLRKFIVKKTDFSVSEFI